MNRATIEELRERAVVIPAGTRRLEGILSVPQNAEAVVVFAHGSGSGRASPRNQLVARELQDAGLGTLLIDLLEEEEAQDRKNVFDIDLLAVRLQAASEWLSRNRDTRRLRQGYFGASTGAAAALLAAARQPVRIGAVVSRGGRPDLALDDLADVVAPTLLIVGGDDLDALHMNQQALARLHAKKELVVIPGATHLFPEPGALEEVARLATRWFCQHLIGPDAPASSERQLGKRFPQADMDLEC